MELLDKELTGQVIESAIEVHKEIGPGLLESAYEACLAHLLSERGLKVEKQKQLPVTFRRVELECGYRIDLLIEDKVIVELKSVERLEPIHEAQLLTYMRLSSCRVGLLINFNVPRLRDGIKRMVL